MVEKNKTVVLAFGTFDLIHPGHIFYLNEAKKLGNKLTVIVARGKNVEKIKGKKPICNEKTRLMLVKSLKPVDNALLGAANVENFFQTVKKINPAVIALGYDQNPCNEIAEKKLKELKIKAKIYRIKPFNEKRFKSSKLKEKIKKRQ